MSLYPDHGSSNWTPPKIPEPRPIVPSYPVVPPKPESCNRHEDCKVADEAVRASHKLLGVTGLPPYADHCHDDCCEDCFGC